jgi:exodeoxyribonuclease VII large subunit
MGEYPGQCAEQPIGVSDLNVWVKAAVDRCVPRVWLEAEVADLSRPQSGHLYMSLKDAQSQVRGVVWRTTASRLPFQLEDGLSILCQGYVDVYSARGIYQFVIQQVQPQGVGAQQLAFKQLHARLSREGLFDGQRKKPLPAFPARIGVVTSPTGAAIHDFLEVLRRRWPHVHVLIIPTRVQGEGATQEIARGIRDAQRVRPPLDVLVIARGGGSTEDLWSFNDEDVVRAVAASAIPTVSAVGHEIDVTLCDLAADVRALTPTEAAERILPNQAELEIGLKSTHRRLDRWMHEQIESHRRRLDLLASRPALQRPELMVHRLCQRLDEWQRRLDAAGKLPGERTRQRLGQLASKLEALSPLRVLERGYCVMHQKDPATGSTGSVIHRAGQLQIGEKVVIAMVDAQVTSRIEQIDPRSRISDIVQPVKET